MVELLVAMAIMGLLIIMAFPTIRAIQANNTKTKYKEYGTSAISATKIYTDSYADDLFASEQSNEFKVVNFDELVRKDLIKDINISEATCITESSVTVVKYKDDYSYCLHLVCKSKNSKPGDKPLYEEENRRGNCSKFTPRRINYIYDTTKSKDAVDGDENYSVLNPSRLGFNFNANHDVFLKWNTKRDGTGKTYNPGDKLDKIEGDVDLYAITRKWEYYLHLNKGIADTGTISDNPKKCFYGSDCPIPENKYTKVGYTFDGWSDGTNKYTDKENVRTKIGNNIPGDGHRVYLTATFKIKSCTVTYSPNGGVFNNNKTNVVQTVSWGSYYGDEKDGMRNARGGYYNATRSGYKIEDAIAWTNGSKTFDQAKRYLAQEVCDLSIKSNTTTLNVNWKLINSITCAAGKYLPKSKSTCATCKSGYYCPGGTWQVSSTADQGLKNCPTGYGHSASGSSKNTQCYMAVANKYYVKNKKDASSTKCALGYANEKHNVYYNSTSACYFKYPFYDADTKKEYVKLNGAIDNVSGKTKTIKMTVKKYTDPNDNAASLNRPGETITLDFGNSTLSLENNNITIYGGTLKIKSGKITTTDAKRNAIAVAKGGKLIITGGEIANPFETNKQLGTEAVLVDGGEVSMSGGKITSGTGKDSGYARGVSISKTGGKFTLSGGTIISDARKVWGGTGINLFGGEFVATGGTIKVVYGGENRCLLCAHDGAKIRIKKGTTLIFDKGSVHGSGNNAGGYVFWAEDSGSIVCVQKGVNQSLDLSYTQAKTNTSHGGKVLLDQKSC